MDDVKTQFSDDNIDIKKILFKVLSFWYFFLASVIISIGIAYYINRSTVPIYQLSGSVMMKSSGNNTLNLDPFGKGGLSIANSKPLEGEIAVIKSYQLISKVLNELDFEVSYFSHGRLKSVEIYRDGPFEVILNGMGQLYDHPVHLEILNEKEYLIKINSKFQFEHKYRFGDNIVNPFLNIRVVLRDSSSFRKSLVGINYSFVIRNHDQLVNEYINRVQVTGRDKSGLILDLTTNGQNIYKEKVFLTKLIEKYIESNLNEKNLMAFNTLLFIDQQLGYISDSLQESEREMVDFRKANRMLDISKESEKNYEILEQNEERKASLMVEQKYYEYLRDFFNKQGDFKNMISPSLMGISEPIVSAGISKLQELYSERVQLVSTVKGNNPRLEQINSNIEATMAVVKANLDNIIERNRVMLEEYNTRILRYENMLQNIPLAERKFIKIQRNYTLHDNIYNYLLQKRAEAGILKASNTPDIMMLDEPRESKANCTYQIKKLHLCIGHWSFGPIGIYLSERPAKRQNIRFVRN